MGNLFQDVEKKVEDYLVKRTENAGGVCLKWQNLYNRKSLDRLLFLPGGRLIVVETKTSDGRMRPGQPYMIKLLRGLGFDVRIVWNKKDVDELFENL